jgi:hypothetical protein
VGLVLEPGVALPGPEQDAAHAGQGDLELRAVRLVVGGLGALPALEVALLQLLLPQLEEVSLVVHFDVAAAASSDRSE